MQTYSVTTLWPKPPIVVVRFRLKLEQVWLFIAWNRSWWESPNKPVLHPSRRMKVALKETFLLSQQKENPVGPFCNNETLLLLIKPISFLLSSQQSIKTRIDRLSSKLAKRGKKEWMNEDQMMVNQLWLPQDPNRILNYLTDRTENEQQHGTIWP